MILRDKTQNLRRGWGADVSENHAQKLGFLSKIGHIGHCGLGRVDFEKKNPKKLPTFTHGTRRAKGARSLIDARSSRLPSGNLSGLGMLNSCFGKSLGPQRTLH